MWQAPVTRGTDAHRAASPLRSLHQCDQADGDHDRCADGSECTKRSDPTPESVSPPGVIDPFCDCCVSPRRPIERLGKAEQAEDQDDNPIAHDGSNYCIQPGLELAKRRLHGHALVESLAVGASAMERDCATASSHGIPSSAVTCAIGALRLEHEPGTTIQQLGRVLPRTGHPEILDFPQDRSSCA